MQAYGCGWRWRGSVLSGAWCDSHNEKNGVVATSPREPWTSGQRAAGGADVSRMPCLIRSSYDAKYTTGSLRQSFDPACEDFKTMPPVTTYRVETSEKFDALCLINLLSGDPFYTKYYPAEHACWREHASAQTLAAARRIKQVLKDEGGDIVSASLVLYFSVSPSTTVAGAIGDLDGLDALERGFERTPYYDA